MRPKPSRVSAFRNCFGAIWSVSTLTRSSGITLPLCVENGCILFLNYLEALDVSHLGPIGRARSEPLGSVRRYNIICNPATILVLITFTNYQDFHIRDLAVLEFNV